LKLGDFCDHVLDKNIPTELYPPGKYVSKIQVENSQNNSWIDRVRAIQPDFGNTLFYLINSLSYNEKELIPCYSVKDKQACYEINEETDYELKVSFYDPTEGKLVLKVENIGDSVNLIVPPGYRVGALRDTARFRLLSQTLTKLNSMGFSRLVGNSTPDENGYQISADLTVELRWLVSRPRTKIALFALFTGLAGLGVIVVNLATKDFTSFIFGTWNIIATIAAPICIGIAASMLYRLFNKK
jgi:hypothetical protein